MNHRERVKMFLDGETTDRVPFVDWGGHPCFIEFTWKQDGLLPQDADLFVMAGFDGSEGPGTDEIIDPQTNKGHFYWPTRGLEWVNFNLYAVPEFESREWTDDSGYKYRIEPLTGGVSKRTPPIKGSPYTGLTGVKPPVQTKKDWEMFKSHFDAKDKSRYPHNADEREVRRYSQTKQSVNLRMEGIWTKTMNALGWEGENSFYDRVIDEPDFVNEILDFHMDFSLELSRPALERFKIDTASIVDGLGYEGGSWASVDMFKEFLLPRYQKMIKLIRSHGIKTVYFDSGGGLKNLIPYLITAGFNGTNYIPMSAGMNIVDLKKEYGKDFILMGGVDRRIVSFGTKPEIKREVERVMEAVKIGGCIPYLDGGVYIGMPYENYLYYADIVGKSIGAK